MEIADSFWVDLPVDDAWGVLLDIERIAPCLPGAQLQEVAGEEYRGAVKVKVGPITATYKGVARIESRDDESKTAVIMGTGRDTRGQGNATARITMTLAAERSGTRVAISTDLAITGKVAQFGRGVMADVSTKLLAAFVANLERDVLSGPVGSGPVLSGPVLDLAATAEPTAPAEGTGNPESSTAPRSVDHPEPDSLDLLALGGGSALRRLAPIVGVGIGVVLVVGLMVGATRRRRSGR